MKDEYIDFFKKVKSFKEEQKKQKQRGLNDYNMVNVVRKENAEVGMHSNIIYSLIDPNGLHYQDDLFLKIFIKDVLEISDFGEIISVNAEELTSEFRRVDFTIKSTNYYIGIEMKIDAGDLENQISHYYEDLQEKASNDSNQEVLIYYLTKNGKDASKYSSNGLEYRKISFEKHILNWIDNCQREVKNITNLNEAFENYKDIVKKVLNKYEGKVMSLKELLKDEKNYELARDISNAFIEFEKERLMGLKTKYIDLILNILEENTFEYINYLPKWSAVDIVANFTIRIIADDEHYLIQIFEKDGYGPDIEKSKKQTILDNLIKVDNKFKSVYSKVYGQLTINYEDFETDKINELIIKLINLNN